MTKLRTYRKEYEKSIGILAQMLTQYDALTEKFEDSGMVFAENTNAGSKKAPIVTTLEALRKDILAYMNSLGLTPAGAKKIETQGSMTGSSMLAEALASMRDDGA